MTTQARNGPIRPADVLVAVLLLFIGVGGTAPAGAEQASARPPDALAYALVVITAASIVGWHRFPLPVFIITGTATSLYLLLGYPFGPILFPAAFAVGGLAASRPLRFTSIAVIADAAVVALVLVIRFTVVDPHSTFEILTGSVFMAALGFAAPAAVGTAWRIRGDSRVRVREEQAKRVVSEERLRMAQEVHDGVGHGLSVIAMQAGVGLHVADRNPDKTKEILETIRQTSRDSLDGLRNELAMLRGELSPRRPGVGLADISVLVDRVRAAGLDITLDMGSGLDTGDDSPDDSPMPENIGFAAYRVVQEALTNVLRHAGTECATTVRIGQTTTALQIEVSDTGSGPPAGGAVEGSGIAGMRERAVRAGGTLDVSGSPGLGFRVRAQLPLTGANGTGGANGTSGANGASV